MFTGTLLQLLVILGGSCHGIPAQPEVAATPTSSVHGSANEHAEEVPVDCSLDIDLSHPQLTVCLQEGDKLVEKYIMRLEKQKNVPICRHYTRFHECASRIFKSCPNIREQYRDHAKLAKMLHKMCTENGQTGRKCLENELKGLIALRNMDIYDFNLEQRTRHHCHFMHHHFRSQEALVASACGVSVGKTAFHLLRMAYQREYKEHLCQFETTHKHHNFDLFRYSDDCPTDFVDQMNVCITTHLIDRNLLMFNSNLSIIALSDVTKPCRHYRAFKDCLNNSVGRCPSGIKMIMDWQEVVRIYLLKMDYICRSDIQNDYNNNRPCYQQTLDSTHSQCSPYWSDLKPHQANLTAYQFYCLPENPTAISMREDLKKLMLCYEDIFSEACTEQAVSYVTHMMRQALDDPYILQMGYKPDCRLHSGEPATTLPSTNTTTSQENVTHIPTLMPRSMSTYDVTANELANETAPSQSNGVMSSTSPTSIVSPRSKTWKNSDNSAPAVKGCNALCQCIVLLCCLLFLSAT